ncbi:hypothetical protein G7K_2733-t1 [Saitoella complicata NRRL Y-17804]|uniref:Uncharacterized protein n=1 Tax=Saitoella complicata (strain BCRC 22490 / CBS 7301 / JCM 7358 / NBRC 10748 / NRRL Y-17804) TaxID=698492 RepID=A0A0E9NGM7_SAICN|nr:hypothetical protein G7K_2733-t1 [Saitoella complicata NRRL Y-17804]
MGSVLWMDDIPVCYWVLIGVLVFQRWRSSVYLLLSISKLEKATYSSSSGLLIDADLLSSIQQLDLLRSIRARSKSD